MEPDCAAILILLDADEECPRELAFTLAERIRSHGSKYPVVIVVAKCAFENWFLASLETIRGKKLKGRLCLSEDTPIPEDAEKANGKKYLTDHMPSGRAYKETEDQEAMVRLIDHDIASKRSRSFRRLCHAIEEIIEFLREGWTKDAMVTPSPLSDLSNTP